MMRASALVFALLAGCVFDRSGVQPVEPLADGDTFVQDSRGADLDTPTDVAKHDTWKHDLSRPDDSEPDTLTPCVPSQCPLGCHPTLPRCARLKPFNFDPQLFH